MTFTVLSAEFVSENNTFKKGFTELKDFAVDCLIEGDEAFRHRGNANTELAGFAEVATAENWRMIHAISALAAPSAPVSRAAYDHIAGVICRAAAQHRDRLLQKLPHLPAAIGPPRKTTAWVPRPTTCAPASTRSRTSGTQSRPGAPGWHAPAASCPRPPGPQFR